MGKFKEINEEELDSISELSITLTHQMHGPVMNLNRDGKYDIITIRFNPDFLEATPVLSKEQTNFDSFHMAQRRANEKYAADQLEIMRLKK